MNSLFVAALLAFSLALPCAQATAEPAAPPIDWGQWQSSKTLADSGQYDAAIEAMLKAPSPQQGRYFYNLGVLYYRAGKLGTSLAYFEKANHLQPRDPDILANLRLVKASLVKTLGDRLDPASSWSETLADRIPLDEVRGILGLIAAVMTGIWCRNYLRNRSLRKTLLHPAGFFGMLAFLITAGLYAMQRASQATPPAFSLESQIVRSGPGEGFLELSRLEAGVKIRVLQHASNEHPGWIQIRYSDSGIGWVPTSSMLLL